MPVFDFCLFPNHSRQAGYRSVIIHRITVGIFSAHVSFPGKILDIVLDPVFLEEPVVSYRTIACIGAYSLRIFAVISEKTFQYRNKLAVIGSGIGNMEGKDHPFYHQRLHIVCGMHVRAKARIIVCLEAHRSGVTVSLVVGLPVRPADFFLLFVFEHFLQHCSQSLLNGGIFFSVHPVFLFL